MSLQAACYTTSDWSIDVSSQTLDIDRPIRCRVTSGLQAHYNIEYECFRIKYKCVKYRIRMKNIKYK